MTSYFHSLYCRLDRFFRITERGSTARIEAMAGLTSFFATTYLLVLIPSLLASGGADRAAATTGTILVFIFSTCFMALYANLPFIVGPGIGGSVLVGVILATTEQVPWQTGLGIACLSGILFFILTVAGVRNLIVTMIPSQIKLGLGASIGLFIAVLGFRNGQMIDINVKSKALMLASFTSPGALVALIGLGVALILQGRKVPGAVLWAILTATAAGIPLGVTRIPEKVVDFPPSLAPVFMQLNIIDALTLSSLPYLFAFFAAEFFSTLGTTLAVGAKANLLDENGDMPNINRPFLVDSVAAALGPIFGIPASTALVESATGVEVGGRTGFSSLVTALLFAGVLLLIPVALVIPKEATAPALILVGISMFGSIRHTHFDDLTDSLPVMLMVLITLISNSFGTGIAGGLLSYVLVKLLAGRIRDVPFGLLLLSIPLGYYFWTVVGVHR